MKPVLLFLLINALVFSGFSQTTTSEIVANWRKGEVRNYDCSLEERVYADRELISEDSFDYATSVEVTEEKGDHYILSYKTMLPSNYETDFYTMWDLASGIPIEVKTSVYGEIEEVTNAPEVLSRMKTMWISTLENIPTSEKIDEMWGQLFEDFENSQDRDLGLVGDLHTMLFWHGSELTVGKTVEFEAYIPGFDMLDDFPADGTLKVIKITEQNVMHGTIDYDLDEAEFLRVITDFVMDFATQMIGTDAPEGAMEEVTRELEREFRGMRLGRKVHFELDLNSGWPVDIRDRVTTEFRGQKEITQTKIVWNDGELH